MRFPPNFAQQSAIKTGNTDLSCALGAWAPDRRRQN